MSNSSYELLQPDKFQEAVNKWESTTRVEKHRPTVYHFFDDDGEQIGYAVSNRQTHRLDAYFRWPQAGSDYYVKALSMTCRTVAECVTAIRLDRQVIMDAHAGQEEKRRKHEARRLALVS